MRIFNIGAYPDITNTVKNNRINMTEMSSQGNTAPISKNRRATLNSHSIQNFYYNTVSFARKFEEHNSWGATVNPKTKEVTFKIFTFPDVKNVQVKILDKNNPKKYKTYPMVSRNKDGVFTTLKPLTKNQAEEGSRYSYLITKADNTIEEVKDPYSARQGNQTKDDFLKYSIIYDHSKFEWKNENIWKTNNERMVRNPGQHRAGIKDARIYEMQIDTFTKEGTFEAAKAKLQKIKDLGFNAIELMPQENTFSFNWGYDGVDKFAPPEHRGGPDKLKELIDEAHGIGLNVIIDYVPNHIGPDGAFLQKTGPYSSGPDDFGDGFNFEGKNSKYVRDYIVNAGLNWLHNYKADGLRLDMTKYMKSDYTMKEIAAEINYHFPEAFLIAEDSREGMNADEYSFWEDRSRLHDKRITMPLKSHENCNNKSETEHCNYINSIDEAVKYLNPDTMQIMLKNFGYDSEWDFSYHHSLDNAVHTGRNMEWLVKAIYQSPYGVKYTTSHDETGNNNGTRPVINYLVPMLSLDSHIILNIDDINRANDLYKLKGGHNNGFTIENALQNVKFQKTYLACEALVKLLAEGKLDKYQNLPYESFYNNILKPLNIDKNSGITYKMLVINFEKSFARFKMAQALTYAMPGPKMTFQGDESLDLTPFRFFREFESVPYEDYLKVEKGYEPGKPALEVSKLDKIKYSDNYRALIEKFENLTKDLNTLNKNNPALTSGKLVADENRLSDCIISDGVIGLHIADEKSENEFFIITNFKDTPLPEVVSDEVKIYLPKGKWKEVLNTEDTRYGGNGKFLNKDQIFNIDTNDYKNRKTPVKIGARSTVYFKKIG